MNNYEELLDIAENENVTVIERYDFSNTRIKGLYCDSTVALDEGIETQSEKACILAEEIGHHRTSAGNITDLSIASNRKQEYRARVWAYNKMIGLRGIINSNNRGYSSSHDMADFLEVTEEFLTEAIQYYRSKYGVCTTVDNYVIYFEPAIGVFELI